MSDRQYTVLVMCIPATGHLNPILCFVNELAKNRDLKVIFFGNAEHQKKIENTNAEYRQWELEFYDPDQNIKQFRKDFPLDTIFGSLMRGTEKIMEPVIKTIENDKIDLLIYDLGTIHARWIMEKMQYQLKNGIRKYKLPKMMLFSPAFLTADNVYPNKAESSMMPSPRLGFKLIVRLAKFVTNYIYFCWKHGLKLQNPANNLKPRLDEMSICCVMPELQPRSHLFPKTVRFVGNCASEEVRLAKSLDEPLKSFLEPFQTVNPLPLVDLKLIHDNLPANFDDIKLIYASFGTLYNHDIDTFKLIIEAVKQLSKEQDKPKIRLLMSTGEKSLARLQEQIDKKQLVVPDNVLLLSRVPQLDVLKRAQLFITHSGQNSTSESIHYGVPMLCIPIFGDQPSVAYRVSDELGLGKRLSLDDVDAGQIKTAITEILDDKSYLERTILFSQISRKYNGAADASKIVIKYLQGLDKKTI